MLPLAFFALLPFGEVKLHYWFVLVLPPFGLIKWHCNVRTLQYQLELYSSWRATEEIAWRQESQSPQGFVPVSSNRYPDNPRLRSSCGCSWKKKKREKEEKKRNSLTPQLASYVIEIAFEANPFFLQKKKNSIGKRDIRKCRSRIVYVFGINSTRSTPYACSVYMTFITFQGTAGYVNVLFTSRRRRWDPVCPIPNLLFFPFFSPTQDFVQQALVDAWLQEARFAVRWRQRARCYCAYVEAASDRCSIHIVWTWFHFVPRVRETN